MARAWRSRAAALAVALIALLGAVSAFKVRSDSAVSSGPLGRKAAAGLCLPRPLCLNRTHQDNEMKKCSDLYFCRTNRARSSGAEVYTVVGEPKQQSDGWASASLRHSGSGASFTLQLQSLRSGSLRLRVLEPGKKRYSPEGILLGEAERGGVAWKSISRLAGRSDAWRLTPAPASAGLDAPDGLSFELQGNPFSLTAFRDGAAVLSLNARQLLHLEPLGSKKGDEEEGAWEEKYNSHTDSKPKGPQSLSLDLRFHGAPALFGIPEHASTFALKRTRGDDAAVLGEPYRLYNLDVYEYLEDSQFGLYGSIPFLLGHAPAGAPGGDGQPLTSGVFWLNSAEQYVDVTAGAAEGDSDAHWWAESGLIDLFIIVGPSPRQLWRQYAALTGAPALPARWAVGYHQCRWNYKDEADVEAVDAGFDAHDMPYDVVWLDIEHTDGKRYMTWDSRYFPTPERLQELVASHGERKTVTIIDPHVKRDDNFRMHSEATRLGLYVKSADGSKDFEGWCWPGSSSYLDVTSPAIRDWWARQFSFSEYKGSTRHLHVWNDMNEPSVFNGPEVTMQKDLLHHGGWEHRDVHNLYGLHYHAATTAGLARRSPEQRPFVLSRAFFAGTQRYGAVWTGDNAAAWPHLAVSVPMLLSVGATGLPFVGADVGGFFGNPDGELMTRWYQLGVYYPFFRGHAHHEAARREPWLFGEPYTSHIKAALRERYALLPYIYTLFAASSGYSGVGAGWAVGAAGQPAAETGSPVARPLWAEFPADASALWTEKQLMLGSALLVCPVVAQGVENVDCYLPGNASTRWFLLSAAHAASGAPFRGGEAHSLAAPLSAPAPVFLRGGQIVPRRERARRSASAADGDPYTLWVSADAQGGAEGQLYLDDGTSTDFSRAKFSRRVLQLAPSAGGGFTLRSSGLGPQGYASGERVERVVFLGLPPGSWAATGAEGEAEPLVASESAGGAAAPPGSLVLRAPASLGAGLDWTLQLSKV